MHKPLWVAVHPARPSCGERSTPPRRVDTAPHQRPAWPWTALNPGGGQLIHPGALKAVDDLTSPAERTEHHRDKVTSHTVRCARPSIPPNPPRRPRGRCAPFTAQYNAAVPSNPSPFDQIARTDAEGNAYWSARDLMPLMGYSEWRNFSVPVNRARKSAENVGMTCNFVELRKRSKGARGANEYTDVHLDRMAAYLVAMNGDPNKPEVAAAQAYFAMQTRRAELGVKYRHELRVCGIPQARESG